MSCATQALYKAKARVVNRSAETTKPTFWMVLVAALAVCSGAAEPEELVELEDDEREAEDGLDVPLALDDEAVCLTVSTMYGACDRGSYL
jgi:hypothetical protein